MQINDITGDVKTKGFEGATEIFNHQIERSSVYQQKVGLSNQHSDQLIVGTLTLTKPIDSATIALMQYYYDKKVIPELIISHCNNGGENNCYISHTYNNVQLVGYDEVSSENSFQEKLTFTYTQCEKRYTPTNTDGSAGSPSSVTYDLAKAKTM